MAFPLGYPKRRSVSFSGPQTYIGAGDVFFTEVDGTTRIEPSFLPGRSSMYVYYRNDPPVQADFIRASDCVAPLTIARLESIAAHAIANGPEPKHPEHIASFVAVSVLRSLLDRRFFNDVANPLAQPPSLRGALNEARKWLKTDCSSDEEWRHHESRLLDLAEIFFNLQTTDGFRARVASIQRDDFESVYGEFLGAALLAHRDFAFRFVTPTNHLKADYDGELTTSTGQGVCCELKTKPEDNAPSKATFEHTLKRALDQLPQGRPALVIIKIPDHWAEARSAWEAAIATRFRHSRRIVAVVILWSEFRPTFEGTLILSRFERYFNDRSPLLTDDIRKCLDLVGRLQNEEWVRFRPIVERKLFTA